MLASPSELDDSQKSLLDLMRTRGLSIKYMESGKKEELGRFLRFLNAERGMSLNDVALLLGNKTSGYTSWLYRQLGVPCRPFEEARLKGIREKRRKYERKPFDGTDEDKAYLLGLRHGDLSVSKPWKGVVRVSTSSTHPAMVSLFRSLFERYGHVYQHPRYKKDFDSFEWNLSTIVDESFDFLFQELEDIKPWLESDHKLVLAYLSGLLDADGSIVTTKDKRGHCLLFACYNNSNLKLLNWVRDKLREMGYPTSLCINKRKGVRSKRYGIIHREDYWQLTIFGISKVQLFLHAIHPRHSEKLQRMTVAMKVRKGDLYSTLAGEIMGLRSRIKEEVSESVKQAEIEYRASHPV